MDSNDITSPTSTTRPGPVDDIADDFTEFSNDHSQKDCSDTGPGKSLCRLQVPQCNSPYSGESASNSKTVVEPDARTLLLEKCSLYLNFSDIMDTLSAFGVIERIQLKPMSKTNSFYIRFKTAEAANKAQNKMKGMKICDEYISAKIFNYKNVMDNDDDYVPEVDLSNANIEKKSQRWFETCL